MAKKAGKTATSPNEANLELRRLQLEEEKFEQEKIKNSREERQFEHQKWVDQQRVENERTRLQNEIKQSSSRATRWIDIASKVVQPTVNTIMLGLLGLLTYQGTIAGHKIQEAINKSQEAQKERELTVGVTSQFLSNFKNLSQTDRRSFATVIKEMFPEQKAFQHFDVLVEKSSPPAARAFWHEAKASIANVAVEASDTAANSRTVERAEATAQESKVPEFAKYLGTSTSAANWTPGAFGSSSLLVSDTSKGTSGLPKILQLGDSTVPSFDQHVFNARGEMRAVSAGFTGTTGLGNDYLFSQPSFLTSAGIQLSPTPSVTGGPQVTVTMTDGVIKTDIYSGTPSFPNGITTSKTTLTLSNNGLQVSDANASLGPQYVFAPSTGNKAVIGIDLTGGTGWSLPKSLGGTDSGNVRMLDMPSGVFTPDGLKNRGVLAGYSSALLDAVSGGTPPATPGILKFEKSNSATPEVIKARVQ